ncbi:MULTISPECIES: SDR family NAD(P)-dependent oxidoreductase [Sanguibacteroides]|uniref:Short-chain dehydrogenase n=1 Tax=Sanguibacteroides justesenii TaxID=1547597 RepID=A0A0C3MHC0_9PORP|nr:MULTISPECIES: SDR family NAD(P)-dependent oxidoreductase [Sanguibacteroides]KIO43775.1 short-chain dehydrogenase [Sanguibacteroides justesenii]KIO45938.1 short-chain dehydrogenase [Sanguibacteroides justesenii]PXZ44980.1 SDR family NAD(P)-dependent oxidoreductase [Sanguibacteroides justesenii]
MNKIALITGVTSGIGKATAVKLAETGFDLIITGRRSDRLHALEEELQKKGVQVISLHFDVRNQMEVKQAISSLPEAWKNIDVLVNNAGLAVGTNPIQDGLIEDWERMIDTNIKGLLYVTREIAPLMIKNQKGHIVNLASVAGKEVYPGGNVYCATKHAVDALSKAMRTDMLKHNIKVTNIAPGMVETEFSIVRYKGDEKAAQNVYNGMTPLTGEDIADTIVFAVTRPAHVCLNDIMIMPTAQANSRDVNRK